MTSDITKPRWSRTVIKHPHGWLYECVRNDKRAALVVHYSTSIGQLIPVSHVAVDIQDADSQGICDHLDTYCRANTLLALVFGNSIDRLKEAHAHATDTPSPEFWRVMIELAEGIPM